MVKQVRLSDTRQNVKRVISGRQKEDIMDNTKSEKENEIEEVLAVPDTALESMSREIEAAGGEWKGNEDDKGAIGWTSFDSSSSDDGTVTVLLPKETILDLPHQSLVRIKSRPDHRSYLGVVVRGPFAEPDGLRSDAPVVVTATIRGRGNILMSNYHGRLQIELLGEELPDGGVVPPRRRPLPNSPVFVLSPEEMVGALRIGGEVLIGIAESRDELKVGVPIKKSVFPRHLGILGTTGGGKSTTVCGFISQLQTTKAAVILLDTEGEYTAIHEPTEDPVMIQSLERRGLSATGIKDTHIYHLVGRETSNPDHPHKYQFSLSFCELSPYAVIEILDLNEPQQERCLKAYDATKIALERLKIFPSNEAEKNQLLELDELEAGYPRMTLGHLYDMVNIIASLKDEDTFPFVETEKFYQNEQEIRQIVGRLQMPAHIPSWRVLQRKLGRIKRLGIFDTPKTPSLNYLEMLKPGRVSIIDLSDTDSPQINNLVIAQLLRGVQNQQDEFYKESIKRKKMPLQTVIFIEEAHEFLSRERIKNMQVLFQQVARIARRGRKRWLGLVFITQLPQHLPDEVLGLISNWVLHKINDVGVVNRLRGSIGGIDDGLWKRLPALAPGQAVVSFTSMARALLVAVDPTPCKLLMAE
jgi:DNA helicase HerA-like ATPase